MNARLLILSIFIFTTLSCKKLEIEETKHFYQKDFVLTNPIMGGYSLTLNPDKTADIVPSGDIMYTGNYKQSGGKIIVTTREGKKYEFKVISDTEIEEKESGIRMILSAN